MTSFNVRKGFLPAPGWLRGFFGEFTWVLPVLHIGIIGMMVLHPLVGLLDQLTGGRRRPGPPGPSRCLAVPVL